jgi:chorismate dehydratase
MISVSAVSYTNSIPFVYGLTHSVVQQEIDLSLDIPSQCADKLIQGQVDIGLVPVAILPQINTGKIISNFCIGAIGKVDTVMLYSQVPLEKIKRIWLDFQSRTSVQLVQVLCREYWHIEPEFLVAKPGYEKAIQNEDAGVVIGDRCFAKAEKYEFSYDLPEHWFQFTGLPFVFAVWLSNKPLKDDFVQRFNQALQFGLLHKEQAMDKFLPSNLSREIASTYLNHRISYAFDASKQQGLQLFLSKIK